MHLNLLLVTEETAEGKKTYLDVYNPTCFVNKYYGTLNEYQVVSDSLQPMDCSTPHFPVLHHLLELVKLMSMSQWCHPTVLSSVTPFSSCPQSFPAAGSFPVSWLFALGGQIIGALASVLPINIKGWFPLGMTDFIFLLSNVTRFFQLKGNLKSHYLISPIFNMLADSSKCFWAK